MKLYKSTIVIWSEFNPVTMELSDLAREAETGEAYCSRMEAQVIREPTSDPDWDGTEFFKSTDETEVV